MVTKRIVIHEHICRTPPIIRDAAAILTGWCVAFLPGIVYLLTR